MLTGAGWPGRTEPAEWFIGTAERGNPSTPIDARRGDGRSYSEGNLVRPLVHGSRYFRRLLAALRAAGPGDLVLFTDWRGDPDELLDGPGSQVGRVLAEAAGRGVLVRGLIWRSHLDRLQFSERENRHLGTEIEAAGGACLLDMRVRPLGSHHQKLVVIRTAGDPDAAVAYVGGIDLCHSRRDDRDHAGDPNPQPMAAVYGPRPPWHDVQLEVRGPAVGDLEWTFRERWLDPAKPSRDPLRRLVDRLRGDPDDRVPLPPLQPDPSRCGPHAVQVLRTYPARQPGYPFARRGERSVAAAYARALGRARHLVYVEDQYLWSTEFARLAAAALAREPGLRLVAVLPRFPDQDGRAVHPNVVNRRRVLDILRAAGGDRVAVYGLDSPDGTPVYVHAKVCLVDDTWAAVGSANLNRRSWTHDSELTCAVLGPDPDDPSGGPGDPRGGTFAAVLRRELMAEHLGLAESPAAGVPDRPAEAFAALRTSAQRLDAWHDGGRVGPRPPGRLRGYRQAPMPPSTVAFATLAYRWVYDPDGRPLGARVVPRHAASPDTRTP